MPSIRRHFFLALSVTACAFFWQVAAQGMREQFLPPLELKPVSFEYKVGGNRHVHEYCECNLQAHWRWPISCDGVNLPDIKQPAQEIFSAGYVVLIVDSFGPREMENCTSRTFGSSAGLADAYAALNLLASNPFVDKNRIDQAGGS